MSGTRLQLAGVTKRYSTGGSELTAIADVSFEVAEAEFVAAVGPSGCGKTTLLNLIAGFESPSQGSITVNNQTVSAPGADRMMIFQEHALFPWLDVRGNIMFGLEHKPGMSRAEKLERAAELLQMVELCGFEKARIHQLSGGMKQRVALARALAPDPDVLLFDEPFGALDALTRERLYAELQQILARTKKTAVFVTHNTREAACLADRVVVMTPRPGRIRTILPIELPRPRDFYDPEVSRIAHQILDELRVEQRGVR